MEQSEIFSMVPFALVPASVYPDIFKMVEKKGGI